MTETQRLRRDLDDANSRIEELEEERTLVLAALGVGDLDEDGDADDGEDYDETDEE